MGRRLRDLRPERADFLRRLIASGKQGRIWTSVDPTSAVPGEERERIVAALDYLEQQGLVELKVADVRQRYTLLQQPPSLDELRDRLAERFDRREQSETERIAARPRARRARRLPGAVARRLLRRDPRRAVRPLQPLPDRLRPEPSGAGRAAGDRTATEPSSTS